MKKLSIVLVTFLALAGMAAYAGPFIGGEIVPSEGTAVPYLAIGWDSGSWIKTSLTLSNPLIADGYYGLSVTPLYTLTPSFRIGGGISVWLLMCDWQFTDAIWAVGPEVVGKWKGAMGWVRFNLPYQISSDAPLFGAWVVLGFAFDVSPCGISPTPGCPALGASTQ